MTKQRWSYLHTLLIALSGFVLFGLEQREIGYLLLLMGVVSMFFYRTGAGRYYAVLYLSLGIIGAVPIKTDISNENFTVMGCLLLAGVLLPRLLLTRIAHDQPIRYRFNFGRKWSKLEWTWLAVVAVAGYLVLPYYLNSTGAYLNWGVENTAESIARLFVGTNALGIWDELFFVSTMLAIFRKFNPFWFANGMQAIVFTSFLHELGFTSWAPLLIYPFALLQGYIFKKTDSLFYVITLHLTLDLVLFLALVNAHHNDVFNIFLTA